MMATGNRLTKSAVVRVLKRTKNCFRGRETLTTTNPHAFVNAVTFVHRRYFNLPPNFDHTRAGITT